MDKAAVSKIMKLVEEGKISADEAMDLIESLGQAEPAGRTTVHEEDRPADTEYVSAGRAATEHFADSEARAKSGAETPPPPPNDAPQSPYSDFVGSIEKIGREFSANVNWTEVGDQLKKGAQQGLDFLKKTAEQVRDGNFGHLFGEVEKREVIMPVSISEGIELRVENLAGRIVLKGGAAENRVTAKATFRGDDREKLKTMAAEYTIMIEERDGQVWIRQPDIAHVNVDFEVELVSPSPMDLRTDHGDITVVGATGNLKVTCASGDITCTATHGSLEAQSSSGDLILRQCTFDRITIESRSGNVALHDTTGSLNVRTASGDVIAQKYAGRTVSIEATTGDVLMDVIEPIEGTVDVRTVSGNINLGIPDGSNARVAISAVRGETLATVDLVDVARSNGKLTGRLGEGQGSIDLSAVSGDVLLRLRDHAS